MSYKDLDIYNKSMELFLIVHPLSLKLPKYELYEIGSQIRRSSGSVVSNIVEGYGRRRYKSDFIKFLIYAHSSNDETLNHILKLKLLYPNMANEWENLETDFNHLGAKINSYIQYVEKSWRT